MDVMEVTGWRLLKALFWFLVAAAVLLGIAASR